MFVWRGHRVSFNRLLSIQPIAQLVDRRMNPDTPTKTSHVANYIGWPIAELLVIQWTWPESTLPMPASQIRNRDICCLKYLRQRFYNFSLFLIQWCEQCRYSFQNNKFTMANTEIFEKCYLMAVKPRYILSLHGYRTLLLQYLQYQSAENQIKWFTHRYHLPVLVIFHKNWSLYFTQLFLCVLDIIICHTHIMLNYLHV